MIVELAGEFLRIDPARQAFADIIANLLLLWTVLTAWLIGWALGNQIHHDKENK